MERVAQTVPRDLPGLRQPRPERVSWLQDDQTVEDRPEHPVVRRKRRLVWIEIELRERRAVEGEHQLPARLRLTRCRPRCLRGSGLPAVLTASSQSEREAQGQ